MAESILSGISLGLCQCGCGGRTTVAPQSHTQNGYVKGQPCRFLPGHNSRRAIVENYRGVKSDGRSRKVHVLVAERALGKPLPPGSHVHHFNEDKFDNRNRNLVICQDAAYHHLLHVRARVVRAGGNPDTQKVCSDCRVAKDFDCFYKNAPIRVKRRSEEYSGVCRECTRTQNATYARRRKETAKQRPPGPGKGHYVRTEAARANIRAARLARPRKVKAA